MKVYTVGYTAQGSMERIEELLKDKHTCLVDIRLSPRSRWQPQWNKRALQEKFGAQYIHIQELGNLNYREKEKDIVLKDRDAGIDRLIKGLSQGYTLILLCACRDFAKCHRSVVIKLLKEKMPEIEIIEEKEAIRG